MQILTFNRNCGKRRRASTSSMRSSHCPAQDETALMKARNDV